MEKLISLLILLLPLSLSAEAIRYYSGGALKNSVNVVEGERNYSKLFLGRKKSFTTPEIDQLLEFSAEFSKNNGNELLQVGDLSDKQGGKIPRHASHQNGLDADVVYLRKNRFEQNPNDPEWAEYFIRNGKTHNIDLVRNFNLFRELVENFRINRIFVDWAVKGELCQLYNDQLADPVISETLRRLRPAKYHQTHFHVRLKCPHQYRRCRDQGEPPRGSGCSEINNFEEIKIPSC